MYGRFAWWNKSKPHSCSGYNYIVPIGKERKMIHDIAHYGSSREGGLVCDSYLSDACKKVQGEGGGGWKAERVRYSNKEGPLFNWNQNFYSLMPGWMCRYRLVCKCAGGYEFGQMFTRLRRSEEIVTEHWRCCRCLVVLTTINMYRLK